jgi:uncharacterized protein YegP (UPF0339 family)
MEVLYQLSYPGRSTDLRDFSRRAECEHVFPSGRNGVQMPEFDAYQDLVGKWRWRLRGGDGRTVATSGESFETHWRALRAAEAVRGAAAAALVNSEPAGRVEDPLAEIVVCEARESRRALEAGAAWN